MFVFLHCVGLVAHGYSVCAQAGWQSPVPWTTAHAASEPVLLSRAGKGFSMGPPKGRQNHYTEFSLLLVFLGWGWI